MADFNFHCNLRISLISLILLSFAIFVIHDLRTYGMGSSKYHKTFESTTGRFLRRSGLIELYEEVNAHIDRKLPILLKQIDEHTKPIFEKTHHFYMATADFFYTLVEPVIMWSDEVLYPFFNSILKT
ncbi:uncharacterized protein LOC141849719 isoform X1 [Brevipalpus obovatus]|uniref:uncharacterized protein LOC141849719 isoform X1 n=1 Tax=Brevipalpus obovatus TaxID=246614 RepID=UPI003D9E1680